MASVVASREARRPAVAAREDHPPICEADSIESDRPLLHAVDSMSGALPDSKEPPQTPADDDRPGVFAAIQPIRTSSPRLWMLLAIPLASAVSFAVHLAVSTKQPAP